MSHHRLTIPYAVIGLLLLGSCTAPPSAPAPPQARMLPTPTRMATTPTRAVASVTPDRDIVPESPGTTPRPLARDVRLGSWTVRIHAVSDIPASIVGVGRATTPVSATALLLSYSVRNDTGTVQTWQPDPSAGRFALLAAVQTYTVLGAAVTPQQLPQLAPLLVAPPCADAGTIASPVPTPPAALPATTPTATVTPAAPTAAASDDRLTSLEIGQQGAVVLPPGAVLRSVAIFLPDDRASLDDALLQLRVPAGSGQGYTTGFYRVRVPLQRGQALRMPLPPDLRAATLPRDIGTLTVHAVTAPPVLRSADGCAVAQPIVLDLTNTGTETRPAPTSLLLLDADGYLQRAVATQALPLDPGIRERVTFTFAAPLRPGPGPVAVIFSAGTDTATTVLLRVGAPTDQE